MNFPSRNKLGVRAIFLTKEKKQSIAGLPIVIAMERIIGNATEPFLSIQGKLATNSNGYVSFKLPKEQLSKYSYFIYPLGYEDLKLPVSTLAIETEGQGIQTVYIDCKTAALIGKEDIPSIQHADILDHEFTPYFNHVAYNNSCHVFEQNIKDPNTDEEPTTEKDCDCKKDPTSTHSPYCDALIPGTQKEECINTYQLDKNGEVTTIENEDSINVQYGVIRKYESCFNRLGYSLGDLIYSTALAPCESVKIAIENWYRKDKSLRSESSSKYEELENEVIRSKSVQEFIKSKLTEHKFNIGIAAALKLKKVPISVNMGYAFGSRKSTTEMVQDINEMHHQLSSAYASYNSLAIYETTQTESRNTTTRHLRNHNHCHTLTLMYFELLENLRVETSHIENKPALFVQYPTPCFTLKDIIAKRHILREVLLDNKLIECLDSICIEDVTCDCSTSIEEETDDNNNSSGDCPATVTELHVSIRTSDKTWAPSEGSLYLHVTTSNGSFSEYIPHSPDNKYKKNKTYSTVFSIPPTCVTDFEQFGLELKGSDKIILASLQVDYTAVEDPNNTYHLFGTGLGDLGLKNEKVMLDNQLNPQLPSLQPNDDGDTPPSVVEEQQAKNCCEANLLQHMNCNKLYYYKIFWMLEDENERAVRFQNYSLAGTPLIDIIENEPLGVIGDWVAFIDLAAEPLPQNLEAQETTFINSPTGSIFSEAIMGQCGTCETIDNSVFWDWTGKTCPDNAPDITTGGLSQFQSSGLTPFNFANSLLSLQALSNLSASASLGSIAQNAIGQSITSIPAVPEGLLDSLLSLLEESQSSGNQDPDYQTAVQDLIDKLGDLKSIYDLIDKIGGNE